MPGTVALTRHAVPSVSTLATKHSPRKHTPPEVHGPASHGCPSFALVQLNAVASDVVGTLAFVEETYALVDVTLNVVRADCVMLVVVTGIDVVVKARQEPR